MNIETIDNILEDWRNGITHGQLLKRYNVTREQEYAITVCADEMPSTEIVLRLAHLQIGMKGKEITEVMNYA